MRRSTVEPNSRNVAKNRKSLCCKSELLHSSYDLYYCSLCGRDHWYDVNTGTMTRVKKGY